jgi:hypothetical protein
LSIAQLPRTMEVSPQLTIFSVVSVIVRPYSLSDRIYDLERTSLTLWTPSV